MTSVYEGKWRSVEGSTRNLERFVDLMGITDPNMRKMYCAPYTADISIKDNTIFSEYKMDGYDQVMKTSMKLDEWSDSPMPDGFTYKNKPTINDNVYKEVSKRTDGSLEINTTRVITGTKMDVTYVVKTEKEEIEAGYQLERIS